MVINDYNDYNNNDDDNEEDSDKDDEVVLSMLLGVRVLAKLMIDCSFADTKFPAISHL